MAAVKEVVLVIEVCGRRHNCGGGGVTALQSLGDASCAAGVVLGPRFPMLNIEDAGLAQWSASLHVANKLAADGTATSNPCGSPTASLTYVANHLNARGLTLRDGQLVIGGAICKSKTFSAGDTVLATFRNGTGTELGTVSIDLVD